MSTPELELIAAVYAELTAQPVLSAAFGDSSYMDWIPNGANYPCLTVNHGPIDDIRGFGLDMIDTQLHVDLWARRDDTDTGATPANVFVREKARIVRDTLDDAERTSPITLAGGYVLARLIHTTTLSLPETSNGIERSRVTFDASVEKEKA